MAKILIVEDNEMNIRLFADLLKSKSHQVFECMDGTKALAMVQALRPDLVLMDIQMPGIDGLTITQMIRKTPDVAHTRVIAVTAFAMDGDAERIMSSGVNAYIPKPISIEPFLQTVNRVLTEHVD